MTASMHQPEPMTAADYRDLADFLDAEAMRASVVGGIHLAKSINDTAYHLRTKANLLEEK